MDEWENQTLAEAMRDFQEKFGLLLLAVVRDMKASLHKLARLLSPLWE